MADQPTDAWSVLTRAAEAAAELAALDPDELTGAQQSEALGVLQRIRGANAAAEAKVLARWDGDRVWQDTGAKTGAAWLAKQQRLPIQVARTRVRHARRLRAMPEVAEAWAAGEIDRSHVATMLAKRTARTAEAFDRDYTTLLDAARTRGFVEFKRHCDRWELLHDPDGAEQGADADRASREVHLSQTMGGMWYGRMTHDPIGGTIVDTTLRAIDQELFDADWAEAKHRLGREPMAMELRRTPAQRRADALVEMAIRARTAPPDGRRPAPLFTVVVGYETLMGAVLELWNRTMVTPGSILPWLSEAFIERVVFDSPSRVIDVGAQRRFFTGALRRAIEVRDRTCFHPYCDEAPDRPEIDHIQEFAHGGETTQTNGRLGCDHHNQWRNTHPDTWDHATDPASPQPNDPHAGPDPPDVD